MAWTRRDGSHQAAGYDAAWDNGGAEQAEAKEASGGELRATLISWGFKWINRGVSLVIGGEEDLRGHLVQSSLLEWESKTQKGAQPGFLIFKLIY